MKTKTTLATLLLAAVMATPSYGGELYRAFWEDEQEFNQRVKASKEKASVPKEKASVSYPSHIQISHDDFEGGDVFKTVLYPEDKDSIFGYELWISNRDSNKAFQPTRLYLILKKQYARQTKIPRLSENQPYLLGWITPNDFRFKTDVMESPRDCLNAAWVAIEDVTDLLNGKKLVVRNERGEEISFSLENEAVAQTLAILEGNK